MPRHKKGERRPAPGRHLVDTNLLIRFLVGDDPPKAARAAALMHRVEAAEEIVEIPEAVVTETVWTLESFYKVPRSDIVQGLGNLLCFAGVRVDSRDDVLRALFLYAGSRADFVDCLLAAKSQHWEISVYTFDETDFKKLGIAWKMP